MCGIAGIIIDKGRARPPEPRELRRMAAALRHRGPDGFGLYLDDACGFAHARLSIIDRAGGAQPMCNEDGSIWITFNGEVFNFVELREELVAAGHVFRSRSDTETIIHAYEEWGQDAWRRFNGQFAIGLWDSRKGELFLVRDRVGICPLFYAPREGPDGGFVAFASEAKAIFAGGRITPKADPAGLAGVFVMWSAPMPGTVFDGVSVVEPGTCVRIGRDLSRTITRYHTLDFTPANKALDPREASEKLEHLLKRAVALRLRADVPVGAYLSGGLDSSVISRLTRLADSSPLRTFSLRFDDKRYDEGSAQQRMSAFLGTQHQETIVSPKDIREALDRTIWHCETPLVRTGPAPMHLLSRLVRSNDFRVVLTGEGADEFLGGYDIFKEMKIRRFWARRPGSEMRPALLARVHPYVSSAKNNAMWRQFFERGLTSTDDPFYSHRLRWDNTSWSARFLSPEVRALAGVESIAERVARTMPAGFARNTDLGRAQWLEVATFMSPYLLASQGDRAVMAHSVEGRYPFLDPDVIDFCCALPDDQKMVGLYEKVLLRRVASKHLPEEVWRRRKWPYRAPIAEAVLGEHATERNREWLSPEALMRTGLLDAKAAGTLATRAAANRAGLSEREEMALVGVLTLQMWHDQFLGRADNLRSIEHSPWMTSPPDVLEDRRSAQAA